MPLKLLLDENLRDGAFWQAIAEHQDRGSHLLDIQRVGDEGTIALGSSDARILEWAAEHGRVLVTQDAKSIEIFLLALHIAGIRSPGVVLLRKGLSIPDELELLILISYCSEPEEWENTIHWLP